MADTRYHVRRDGSIGRCHAQIKCRLTPGEAHGATPEEAKKNHEAWMEQQLQGEHLQGRSNLSKVPKEQRPRPIQEYKDRKFPVPDEVISVPHDPQAKYAVLSDVDGTLTRGSLVLDHAIYLHERGVINLGNLPQRWKAAPKDEKLIVALAEKYRDAIRGKKVEDLQVEEFLDEYDGIQGKFYSTLDQLRTFKKRGWEVQLISGSPDFLVQPFAQRNGFYGRGSDYHVNEEGYLNGSVDGMFGHDAKEGYISKLNVKRFKRVLAFGDTASDVPLFNNAHHSTLVDPSEETEANVKASVIIRD